MNYTPLEIDSFDCYYLVMSPQGLITTAEVCRIAGVGPTAVKRWADQGLLRCVKTGGGHRRFERAQVEALVRAGASEASEAWNDWIGALLDENGIYATEGRLMTERSRLGSWYQVAARMGDLLAVVGRRWVEGTLSIGEEHLITARLQRALARVSESLPLATDAPRCLLATAEADEHTGGLSLVELCLREAGWRTLWAGARMPSAEVAAEIVRLKPAMVALSASATADPAVLARQADVVGQACRQLDVALALGGAGAWPDPPPYGSRWRALEAFSGFADSYRESRAAR